MLHDILTPISTQLAASFRISRQFQDTCGEVVSMFRLDTDTCLGRSEKIRTFPFHSKNDRLLHSQAFKDLRGNDRLEQIGLFQENETDVGQRPEFAHAALWLLLEHDYIAKRHFVSHPDKRLTFSPVTNHQKDNIFCTAQSAGCVKDRLQV